MAEWATFLTGREIGAPRTYSPYFALDVVLCNEDKRIHAEELERSASLCFWVFVYLRWISPSMNIPGISLPLPQIECLKRFWRTEYMCCSECKNTWRSSSFSPFFCDLSQPAKGSSQEMPESRLMLVELQSLTSSGTTEQKEKFFAASSPLSFEIQRNLQGKYLSCHIKRASLPNITFSLTLLSKIFQFSKRKIYLEEFSKLLSDVLNSISSRNFHFNFG